MTHGASPIDRPPPPFYETRQMDSETTAAFYQGALSPERIDILFPDLPHTNHSILVVHKWVQKSILTKA